MKTIYNTYVVIKSQEQCDRMKQLCTDNKLLENYCDTDFYFDAIYKYFQYCEYTFYLGNCSFKKIKITEKEFIKLLKNTKL